MGRFYSLANKCHWNHLSYVIGVLLGDGCIYESHYRNIHPYWGFNYNVSTYTIEMTVKDKSFAEEFCQRLDMVLYRSEYRRHHIYQTSKGYWRVCMRSRSFGLWWNSLIQAELETYALAHPPDFLRGIYDSEGNLSSSNLRIFTTDIWIKDIVCKAVTLLGLQASPRIFRPAGNKVHGNVYNGISNKDLWVVHISPRQEFLSLVGSSIPRKATL